MQIKICGLTKVSEANFLNKNNVDYAGFVLFFPKSKRNNSLDNAKNIMKALKPSIKKVAVVVSPSVDEIKQIEESGFDFIQIHKELSDKILNQISLPILKAFNVNDMAQFETYRHCDKVVGYVFDAQEPGSGKTFDWTLLKNLPTDEKLFLLAGGLSSENVAEAIKNIHPDGVDVSSGVEYTDKSGKDPYKIDSFVQNVRTTVNTSIYG